MSIWVLTSEYNNYDQYGEYFEDAWDHKPTEEELQATLKDTNYKGWMAPKGLVAHILEGGGRQGVEDSWYYLRQHK